MNQRTRFFLVWLKAKLSTVISSGPDLLCPNSLGDLRICSDRALMEAMAPRFITILTGRKLPKIWHQRAPEPSIINEKTVAAQIAQGRRLMGSERHQPKPAATERKNSCRSELSR